MCNCNTQVIAIQKPITYSLIILNKDLQIDFQEKYTGYDCIDRFLESLQKIDERYSLILNQIEPMQFTQLDLEDFNKSNICHICEEKISQITQTKVRDHCHLTGKYLGPAHNECNLKRQEKKYIPFFS